MRSKSIRAIAVLATTLATVLATVLAGGTATLVPAGAATANGPVSSARAGSYTVDARVNKTEPLLNSKVTIRATVKPAAPGAAVTLQVKYDDRKSWKTIDHGRLSAAGKVTFKDKVGSVRSRRYRVVKPAGDGHGAGQGTAPRVTVFGWRDLVSLAPARAAGFSSPKAGVRMNGVDYPSSLQSYAYVFPPNATNVIDYNLNRDCKAFRGVAGVDDSSPTGGTAQVYMATDGADRYSGAFALTQTAPVSFAVTNVFRLTISASLYGGGIAAVGTPQVLCSF